MSTTEKLPLRDGLPTTVKDWMKSASADSVLNSTIWDLESTASASKISRTQFLTLRVIVPPSKSISYSADYFQRYLCGPQAYQAATDYLDENKEWQDYLKEVSRQQNPTESIGLYSLTWHQQHAIFTPIAVKNTGLLNFNSASPKIMIPPTPPVAHRTRARANIAQILATEPTSIKPQQHIEDDRLSTYPKDIPSPATPESPALPHFSVKAEDEQIVNTALILLLISITKYHPQIKRTGLEWTLKRKVFKFGPSEARTDGFLCDAQGKTRAILEVKPFVRRTDFRSIQMQEAAQLAAWNYSENPEWGTALCDNKGTFRYSP